MYEKCQLRGLCYYDTEERGQTTKEKYDERAPRNKNWIFGNLGKEGLLYNLVYDFRTGAGKQV